MLCKNLPEPVTILQIKEKFGGLRFYVGGAPNYVHVLIFAVESNSFSLCENCGKQGKLKSVQGWDKTLCKECEDVREWK